MNFYDKIYELVNCFKETNEYKKYIEVKSKLKLNTEAYQQLKEFKEIQRKNQIDYISSQKVDEEKQKQIQDMYIKLVQNEDIKNFFDCEIKLDVMLADMQKIIGDGLKELIDIE